MERAAGRPSGFDYLRLSLALIILVFHGFALSAPFEENRLLLWEEFPQSAINRSLLPMFFALSGFLVAGSLVRTASLGRFLWHRAVRIYPALFVEICLTALLLGPFVTILPLDEYFRSPGFFRYLGNITGHTTQYLPGSFIGNPREEIANIQLWTVPYELICYLALSVLVILGFRRERSVILLAIFFMSVFVVAKEIIAFAENGNGLIFVVPQPAIGRAPGTFLVISFLLGVAFFAYRFVIPVSATVVAILIAAIFALFNLQRFGPTVEYFGEILALGPVAYLTCAIGVFNPYRVGLLRHADLSYGIFLYHGIIQQTIIYALPSTPNSLALAAASLPVTALLAAMSWHYIEKPALAYRNIKPPRRSISGL